MRKRLISIFTLVALMTVSGPLEMFAATAGAEAEADKENAVAVEQMVTDEEELVTDGEAVTDTDEEIVTDEEAADADEEEKTEDAAEEEPVVAPAEVTAQDATELNVTVAEEKQYSVKLSWTYGSGESLGDDQTITIMNDGTEVTSGITASEYTVTDLTPSTSYNFTVNVENTTLEETVTATTAAIGTVKNFRSLSSYKKVKLKWSKVSGASKYVVKCVTTGKTLLKKNATYCWDKKGFPAFDIKNTKNGPVKDKDRTYTITAYDSDGNVIATAKCKGYPVRTMYYKFKFKAAVTLTSHSGGSYKTKFKKNQIVFAKGFTEGKYVFDYKCKDGKVRTYYAMKIRGNATIWKSHIDPDKEYSVKEAEMYVNARGIDSKKKYMIWVNTYTQRLYAFKGSKGNWECVKGPWLVSTGKATKPTSTGSTNINRKMASQNGICTWSVTRYFSLHGKSKSWKLGWPRSGACVRNTNTHAKWIYNTCPIRTRVYVF